MRESLCGQLPVQVTPVCSYLCSQGHTSPAAGLPVSINLSPGLNNWPRMAPLLWDLTSEYSGSNCLSRIKVLWVL